MSTHTFGRPTPVSVGICAFTGPKPPPIRGQLKTRFSDFIVREITPRGDIVQLKSLVVDQAIKVKQEVVMEEGSFAEVWAVAGPHLSALLSPSDMDKMNELVSKGCDPAYDHAKETVLLEPDEDKEHRTAVHQAVKTWAPFLETATAETKSGKKAVLVQYKLNKDRKRKREHGSDTNDAKRSRDNNSKDSQVKRMSFHGRPQWPQGLGNFCHFTLAKQNTETHSVLSRLCGLLRVNAKAFEIAGTKDKRGVTFQRISVNRILAERLASLNAVLPPHVRLGDFAYGDAGLKLGELSGNQFNIVLRHVTGADGSAVAEDVVVDAVKNLAENGFVNYYGLQRFGSNAALPTHVIGAALLRGDWSQAVRLILTPRDDDQSEAGKELRELLSHGAYNAIDPRRLPHHMVAEKSLVLALKEFPDNHFNALMTIQRNLRTMYTHALQSVVFNKMVTRRLQAFPYPHKVVVGDLVRKVEPESEVPVAGGGARNREGVTLVESEEQARGLAFKDVVMPLPGHAVLFPTHSVGKEAYREAMAEFGVDLELVLSTKASEFALSGDYRTLVIVPTSLNYSIIPSVPDTEDVSTSELDQIIAEHRRNNDKPLEVVEDKPSEELLVGEREIEEVEEVASVVKKVGEGMALRVEFCLPSSCYATMCLRQLTADEPVA